MNDGIPAQLPHPALRMPSDAPRHGGPVGAVAKATKPKALKPSPWPGVPTVGGIPVMLRDAATWCNGVLDIEAEQPIAQTSLNGIMSYARYVPSIDDTLPLRVAVRKALSQHRGALALELGCSVGPDLRALRERCTHVIGIDTYLPALRLARAHLDGLPIPWPNRIEGRRFHLDERTFDAVDNVTVLVADALDVPLHDQTVDIVLALNVLDNVSDPRRVLAEIERVLKPGGLLVLGSPFAWQEHITPIEEQLGGHPFSDYADTPSMLPDLLEGYDVLSTEDVPWVLKDHARAEFHYLVHLVSARHR